MLPLIIEPEELHPLLGSSNIRLIDLCNEQSYAEGHLPGAISVLPQELMASPPPAVGKLPSKAHLTQLFERIGLTPDTHFVVYDDEGGGWAGRMVWLMDVIGHQKYSYLNGGLLSWKAAKLPLSTEPAITIPRKVTLHLHPHPFTAELEEIEAHLEDGDFLVWDARGPAEYRGEKVFAKKGGHIPGAINCEWTQLMDQQRQLRIRPDAKEFLAQLGIDRSKKIVTHCQTHHRSGLTYLVGKSLGLNIRAYHGSWSEWGNHPTTPVEQ